MATERILSAGEELANSITHGLGLALSLIAAPVLVVSAAATDDPWRIVAASIYAATLVSLYLASTLYHAARTAEVKAVLRRVDHAAIYLLIAGTYTPFTLVTLRGPWGWTLFGVVWGLALAGVLLKSLFGARLPALSTVIYLAMGWMIVLAIRPLSQAVDPAGLRWLMLGGALYTGGVVFYVWERIRFGHAVWHLFVIGGSMAHFMAVLWYAIPLLGVS
jgi:hemolysin III